MDLHQPCCDQVGQNSRLKAPQTNKQTNKQTNYQRVQKLLSFPTILEIIIG
jgi:hypothetical protein